MEKLILATVGDKEITNLDVEKALSSLEPYQAMHFQSEEGKQQLLLDLVNQELFLLEAKEENIADSDDFKAEMKRIEETVLKQFSVNKLLNAITVTEDEMKDFFEANKEKFAKEGSVSAKHILVDTKEQAEEILAKIKSGDTTLEEAAKEFSSCPSKEEGGNLGEFTRGQMVPEFEEAAFNLNTNEVSDIVETSFGYHIIKVTDKKQGLQTLEEVRDSVEMSIKNILFEEYLTEIVLDVEALINEDSKLKVNFD